ncbi:hypothetical protein A2U01_0117989, partial [Trifolium medium]|nr:hypothetical protein [Trifolium medium]
MEEDRQNPPVPPPRRTLGDYVQRANGALQIPDSNWRMS